MLLSITELKSVKLLWIYAVVVLDRMQHRGFKNLTKAFFCLQQADNFSPLPYFPFEKEIYFKLFLSLLDTVSYFPRKNLCIVEVKARWRLSSLPLLLNPVLSAYKEISYTECVSGHNVSFEKWAWNVAMAAFTN